MPTTATDYLPFDAGVGANVLEDRWRKMAHLWVPSGPVRGYLNGLLPFGDSTGLQYKVKTGAAHIRGHYGEWTVGDSIMSIAAVSAIPGGQSRLDRSIVRADFVNNRLELDTLTGTAAASPALPSLTQSTSIWEELLGDLGPWTNATTTVAAAAVIDRRKFATSETPGASWEKIDEVGPLTASQATLPFSSIPSGFRALRLEWLARSDNASGSAAIAVQFNGDTAANYEQQSVTMVMNTVTAAEQNGVGAPSVGTIPAATATASYPGHGHLDIPLYGGTSFFKQCNSEFGYELAGGSNQKAVGLTSVTWKSTAAITSLLLLTTGNFITGSWAGLYGIP